MTQHGFFRAAACVPRVEPGQCAVNAREIADMAMRCASEGAEAAVFPEMSVTGYTCADLFHNQQLLDDAIAAIKDICARTRELPTAIVVGAPLSVDGTLYNCAFVIASGRVQGIVPKTYIPNYNEFYEKRWWQGAETQTRTVHLWDGCDVTFGTSQLFRINGVNLGIEICEDLWVPAPPSNRLAMSGAEVILNLSASDDTIGKYAYLRRLIENQSASALCGYVYASAGYGESSTDLVFDGKAIIAECGKTLAVNPRWQTESQVCVADIDILAIRHDRMHNGSFADCRRREGVNPADFKINTISLSAMTPDDLRRSVDPLPFVPSTDADMADRCDEIVNIQVMGLCRRLSAISCRNLVIGISGGLDSTLALLVAHRAFVRLGYDTKGITSVTMPGFGTTGRTHSNALVMMKCLGVTAREINIVDAVKQHFSDIGHDIENHNVTYENSQARERTQILMDVANQVGGIVLGTGDLSELALGWCTYNGDQMSMYGINAGVPKTLVRYLVRYFALSTGDEALRGSLLDVIDTPISPELTPAESDGTIKQRTEDIVGPYPLHDFFLYHLLRYGRSRDTILYLACKAFEGEYDRATIEKWLATFMRRFFSQQFKRSCMPDGPKVGGICLSPRGDWRMPSDMRPH